MTNKRRDTDDIGPHDWRAGHEPEPDESGPSAADERAMDAREEMQRGTAPNAADSVRGLGETPHADAYPHPWKVSAATPGGPYEIRDARGGLVIAGFSTREAAERYANPNGGRDARLAPADPRKGRVRKIKDERDRLFLERTRLRDSLDGLVREARAVAEDCKAGRKPGGEQLSYLFAELQRAAKTLADVQP